MNAASKVLLFDRSHDEDKLVSFVVTGFRG
jgi:hypothetical protein